MITGNIIKLGTVALAVSALSACITVEPASTSGKAAVKTASVIKKIKSAKKPTMNIPASYATGKSDYTAACASAKAGEMKRIMVVDGEDVSEVMVKCKAPKSVERKVKPAPVAPPAPRTIRLSVDGGPDQVFQIDANGKAIPASAAATQSAAVSMPAPQIVESAPIYIQQPGYQTEASYQAPAETRYRVRRGDTLYSIASRNCVALDTLIDINGISRPYTINPDQLLALPGAGC